MTQNSKMLERVRALLAKAEATTFEAEADAFREKADQLMTAYAIEQWMVEAAQDSVGKRPTPELRYVDINWYDYGSGTSVEFRSALWHMFARIAGHCRCVVVPDKTRYADGENGRTREVAVVGLPSDIDYFDLLFTNVMIDFLKKLNPSPNPNLSVEDNVYMLRSASKGWPEIARLMLNAGLVKPPKRAVDRYAQYAETNDAWKDHKIVWGDLRDDERQALRSRLAKTFRDYCKETGREQLKANPGVYARSYARGFQLGLGRKLDEMADKYDPTSKTNDMAVALRDIRQTVRESVWDFFPDMRPHPETCECAECHFQKCVDPDCKRPRCVEARKPVRRGSIRYLAYDPAGATAGRKAASEVNLANPATRRMRQTKELS